MESPLTNPTMLHAVVSCGKKKTHDCTQVTAMDAPLTLEFHFEEKLSLKPPQKFLRAGV